MFDFFDDIINFNIFEIIADLNAEIAEYIDSYLEECCYDFFKFYRENIQPLTKSHIKLYCYALCFLFLKRLFIIFFSEWGLYFANSSFLYTIIWGSKFFKFFKKPLVFLDLFRLLFNKIFFFVKYPFSDNSKVFFSFFVKQIRKLINIHFWKPLFKKTSYIGYNNFIKVKNNLRKFFKK